MRAWNARRSSIEIHMRLVVEVANLRITHLIYEVTMTHRHVAATGTSSRF